MRPEQREKGMQNSNVATSLLHSQQLGKVFNFDVSASGERGRRNYTFCAAKRITTEMNAER